MTDRSGNLGKFLHPKRGHKGAMKPAAAMPKASPPKASVEVKKQKPMKA